MDVQASETLDIGGAAGNTSQITKRKADICTIGSVSPVQSLLL
jgi:hypothetical protein